MWCCHLESQIKLIYDIAYITLFSFFDHPDDSTSWCDINYDILVKFNSPDGTT